LLRAGRPGHRGFDLRAGRRSLSLELLAVTRADDPRVDDFRDLTDADVRPDRRGIVIAEGVNVVSRLVGSPYRVRAVIGVPARLASLEPVLAPLDVPVYSVDKWLLSDIVGFRVTPGVLASGHRPAPSDRATLLATAGR